MKWRNTFTKAISVILIQENCFSEYIWFIMKLEKQRTNLGVFVSTCTTGKSLLGTESKSQYTVERVWGMAFLTSYLTCSFISFVLDLSSIITIWNNCYCMLTEEATESACSRHSPPIECTNVRTKHHSTKCVLL